MSKHPLAKPGSKQAQPQRAMQVVEQQVTTFSGPLPPADQLERYEQISPGFAQAILAMAQKSQEHAHDMDRETLAIQKDFTKTHLRYFGRGQVIGGILGLAGIIGGTVVAASGAAAAGAGIIAAVMGGLGAAFAWGKWQERDSQRPNKAEQGAAPNS